MKTSQYLPALFSASGCFPVKKRQLWKTKRGRVTNKATYCFHSIHQKMYREKCSVMIK